MEHHPPDPPAPVSAPPAEPLPPVPPAPPASPEETLAPQPLVLSLPSAAQLARWTLVAIVLYAIGWLLWSASATLTPFIFGLVLAYLLLPAVNFLDRTMPRALSILVVYVAGIVILAASFAYLIPLVVSQVERLLASIPTPARLQEIANEILQQYRQAVPDSVQQPVDDALANAAQTAQANIATYVQRAGAFLVNRVIQLLNTLTFLLGFIALPFWLFYVLNDVDRGRESLDQLLHPRLRADFWNVWTLFDRVLSSYVRGQLILCAAVGVAVGIGLLVLQLLGFAIGDYILVLALIAGITEFIPVLGPTIGAVPGILIGLSISPTTGLVVALIYFGVQQLENSLLVPRIIGESVGIHPAVLTVLMLAMGYLFGLLGIIFAPPAAAIVRDLFVYAYKRLGGRSARLAYDEVLAMHRPPPPPAKAAA